MVDAVGNTIELGDIIIHHDNVGLWFAYVVELKKASLKYRIISSTVRFQDDTNYPDAIYGARPKRVIVINDSKLAQTLKGFGSYISILKNYGIKGS